MTVLLGLLNLEPAFSEPEDKRFPITNAHEHIQSRKEAIKLLEMMDRMGIQKTLLVGSPEATILTGRQGFQNYESNNQEILDIAKEHPGRFIPFVTLDPKDPDKLVKFKRDLERGARGLKLYSGHGLFHDLPLNDPVMDPVYVYCEAQRIPILFHVNAGFYLQEFESVLQKYPRLKIICPHFCLSTIASQRFGRLMDQYPNLYTDASFGVVDFLTQALLRFSKNPEKYRRIILKYQDRIFYGTDIVITDAPYKSTDWLYDIAKTYRSLLEEKTYTTPIYPFQTLRGLALPASVLKKVYTDNFDQFIAKNS